MNTKNKFELIGTVLIILGTSLAVLSFFTEIKFINEGVFVSSIGLGFLGYGNSKKKNAKKEKDKS